MIYVYIRFFFFFFFNDTATTEIYTLSLHDALPISGEVHPPDEGVRPEQPEHRRGELLGPAGQPRLPLRHQRPPPVGGRDGHHGQGDQRALVRLATSRLE